MTLHDSGCTYAVMGHRLCAHVATFTGRTLSTSALFSSLCRLGKWGALGRTRPHAATAAPVHMGVVGVLGGQPLVSWLELDKRSLFGQYA